MQTPAMTAQQDIRRFSRKKNSRNDAIRKRADAIVQEMIISENLMALYRQNPSAALTRYSEMQTEAYARAAAETPRVTLTTEESMLMNRARFMRGTFRKWRSDVSQRFNQQMTQSAETVRTEIKKGNELIAWFSQCIPSIAEYTGEADKTEFTNADVIKKGNATVRKSDAYRSIVAGFQSFINKWQDTIDDYQDELDLYEDDPLGDLIATVESIGLVQVLEDSNDGYLWFIDAEDTNADTLNPQTDTIYYISLYNRCAHATTKVSVLDRGSVREGRLQQNWKKNWATDLTFTVIGWGNSGMIPYEYTCRAYFGLYDSLRPWIARSIESGNTPPDFFPTSLQTV